MEAVAVAHDRRVLAGAEAFDRLAAELAVVADLAVFADSERQLQVSEDLLGRAAGS